MEEGTHRFYDTIIKAVTALVALGVAFAGLLQYRESVRNNSVTQQMEQTKLQIEQSKLNLELNRQKADILSRAALAAADATWAGSDAEQLKAINQFSKIFVGEVFLVGNKEVIDTGDRLNDTLDEIHGFIEPKYGAKKKYLPSDEGGLILLSRKRHINVK